MKTVASKAREMFGLLRRGGPALCNIAVTNSCNAACGFCNFARGKVSARHLRWLDPDQFPRALDILYQRDVRYLSFFGGEPLLHPHLAHMIELAVVKGMGPSLITNGWLLPQKLDELSRSGLQTIYISLDAADLATHDTSRGLKGLGERIRSATSRMRELGMQALAQVTMNKLVRDYRELAPLLRELGFAAVAFSYPQQRRLGSSSLAWSDSSPLVKFTTAELIAAFDSINKLRKEFPVTNPRASIADMKRHLRGENEKFSCYGGYKSFYMDWNYDMWRCDSWSQRIGPIWEFADAAPVRDGCTACIADCYRDSSVMLHFAVALGDSMDRLKRGHVFGAVSSLADARNFISLGAVLENAHAFSRLARFG